jgi:uncharacterized membrane protein YeaQ/YmgE (transglycosylase-associated protein family)
MTLIILINLGALLGWLGSIVMRLEIPGAVLRMIFVGIAASLVTGLIANGGVFLGSLSWLAMGVAVVATIAAVIGYFYFATREA